MMRNIDVTPQAVGPRLAAKYLGISEGKIRLMLASGELQSVRIGTRLIITFKALDELIANGTTT